MKKGRIIALIIGSAILFIFILMAAFPEIFTDYGQKEMFAQWEAASGSHILGTNDMGYDIFTEIVYGARETLITGVAAGALSLIFGAVIGLLASFKGVVGNVFNGLINMFVMLPKLICLIVLSAFFGRSYAARIFLIAAFNWVSTARVVRAKALKIKNSVFIENCLILGYGKGHIAVRHVIPNLYDVLAARFILGINSSIMMESSLSFLGIGDLYNPTWGAMVNLAYKEGAFLRGAYNYLLTPAVCISLLVLAFYLVSLGVGAIKERPRRTK